MPVTEAIARQFLHKAEDRRILVLGDVMLDRFVYGPVDRISPEAPIPVVRADRQEHMLGGAGNVARNLTALGFSCTLIGAIGDDEAGAIVRQLADNDRIDRLLTVSEGRKTTSKWRFIGASQQLLRVDWEEDGPLPQSTVTELSRIVAEQAGAVHAVILSDYGKGVLSDQVLSAAIAAGLRHSLPVVVDPKGTNYIRYRGASVVTPNKTELRQASGNAPTETDEEVSSAARAVLERSGIAAMVATRGASGLAVVDSMGETTFRQSRAREVFDVSGAGDTVIAILTAAIAQGLSLVHAADLANAGAGVVVSKLGTSVVAADELMEAIRTSKRSRNNGKLKSLNALLAQVENWKQHNLQVGFTNGCFDLLHPGHIHLLEQARNQCDRLIVGLNSDASVTRLKGEGRPIYDEAARAILLSSLASVDAVVVFEEDTPLNLISAIVPTVLIKGADYSLETVVGHEIVEAAGGRIFLADLKVGFSTTRTLERLS